MGDSSHFVFEGGGPFRKFLRILFLFEFWGNFLSFQGRRDGNARSKQGKERSRQGQSKVKATQAQPHPQLQFDGG